MHLISGSSSGACLGIASPNAARIEGCVSRLRKRAYDVAFGLEENGQFAALKRQLVARWHSTPAIRSHSFIAYVMEMQGREREGLEFLAATESAWMDTTTISVHLAWHRALLHLDADDPVSAPAVYDAQIANMQSQACQNSPMLRHYCDAYISKIVGLTIVGVHWLSTGKSKRLPT